MSPKNGQLRILLVSCYELGQQPLGIAWPAGFLKRAGFRPRLLDLATESASSVALLADDGAPLWDLIAISAPMHTAMTLALSFGQRVRSEMPRVHLSVFGHYAYLHRDRLRRLGADSVLSAECEEELVRIAEAIARGERANQASAGVGDETPRIVHQDFPLPERSALPPLSAYTKLRLPDDETRLVGSVESSRGCRHLCRHCPIPPVYSGRVFVVPDSVVLQDIDQLVESGAEHIHFVDADFLNAPKHAMGVCRTMHARHPQLTFDFTAKVEHLLSRARLLKELDALGCLFITTAVESLSDSVLEKLHKGHRRSEVESLRVAMARTGIAMKATWLPFTPWTTREGYLEILDWIVDGELVEDTDLIQLTIRLLIPPGSLLFDDPSLADYLVRQDVETLSAQWKHPDAMMDSLQKELAEQVERLTNAETNLAHRDGFNRLYELAQKRLRPSNRRTVLTNTTFHRASTPRLTEHWFC